jgi:periplasmic protein TonB
MLAPPPPFIPPPLVQIAQPPPVPVIASVTHVQPVAPRPPAPAPQPVARTGARLETGGCSPPPYPEQAQDDNESGTTVMQFLVSTTGAVLTSRVAVSSGHAVLDDAALAGFSLCKFSAAIGADGQPQESWVTVSYLWELPQD